jgi:hypothetical protein
MKGYSEFEFDLPGALLTRLVEVLNSMEAVPLTPKWLDQIPEEQGVYQLFVETSLVYIGKTDADAGLRRRLTRHAKKITQRKNIDFSQVMFKAVRIFVFTAMDLESDLIRYYEKNAKLVWNKSGFGSNDPGVERDTTKYKPNHFDTMYPIDVDLKIDFPIPLVGSAADVLYPLKAGLGYLLRFHTHDNWRKPHPDLAETKIMLNNDQPLTVRSLIEQVVNQLPSGWHATALPSHIIMYKDDTRRFPSGTLLARS